MNIEDQKEPLVNQRKKPEMTTPPKKDASIIKQLNDKNIYPAHERIGIYIIAALSVFGILLIAYTGIRLFFVSTGIGDQTEYTPTPTIPTPSQNTDSEIETNEAQIDEDENIQTEGAPQTGTTNGDGVNIRQEANNDSIVIEQIGEGVEVTILDYHYNDDWIQISFDGTPAYIWRDFLDVEY